MPFAGVGGTSIRGGYLIDNSLRFNDDDTAYLSRTPSSTTNRRTWTWSSWVKVARGDINLGLFNGTDSTNQIRLNLFSGKLNLTSYIGATRQYYVRTEAIYRDVSAWYHFVVAFDTTQATASNRVKFYVNGELITNFTNSDYPTLNYDDYVNTTNPFVIGYGDKSPTYYFDGYMAEVNFIDGQQLDASSFGEFDEDSGIWKPIEYTGTYGTNGFYLDFENSGSLGADQSGNGNNFTPTNLASTDQTTDTPTNNFATLNPLSFIFENSAGTLSEGNLKHTNTGGDSDVVSTIGISSGKFYAEFKAENALSDRPAIAVYNNYDNGSATSRNLNGSVLFLQDGRILVNNSSIGDFGSISQNDIIQVAVDNDNGAIYIGQNGTYLNSGDPTSGSSRTGSVSNYTAGSVTSFIGCRCNSGSVASANFGNPAFSISSGNSDENGYGNFEYAPPSGYLALCTQNLATELSPTIDDGSQYFNTVLYTGTGTTQSITGVGFQPDLVWLKARTSPYYHNWYDSIRGGTKALFSNANVAEATDAGNLQTFISDGFTADGFLGTNGSGVSYVAWNWKANGGTTSSNTDGDITTTVQANTTSGFSILTWTGNGIASQSIGHGLGIPPKIMIQKNRDQAVTWQIFGSTLFDRLQFDTGAEDANFPCTFSSSTITLPNLSNNTDFNSSGDNFVSYVFADIEGYSKFGSYTGNGSTDGTFVYTGFRPSWIMIKNISGTSSWAIFDNKRNTFNVVDENLFANLSDAESTFTVLDSLSNGFKIRTTLAGSNTSGSTYIYMAFAENPFVSSTGIPVVAR
jgi:hypothetical protein